MGLEELCNYIILLGAVVMAIYNIINTMTRTLFPPAIIRNGRILLLKILIKLIVVILVKRVHVNNINKSKIWSNHNGYSILFLKN